MISILACASGRIESYRQHLTSVADQPEAQTCEYCITSWGDDANHTHELLKRQRVFGDIRWRHIHPNVYWPLPMAYNTSLAQATGDYVLIVGADVKIGYGLLAHAMANRKPDTAWCYGVTNSDGQEFIGPTRKVAIPYVTLAPRANLAAMKGWRHDFCNGTCYDDNDFALRLLMTGISYRWNFQFANTHIAHPRFGGKERERWNERNRAVWLQGLMGYQGPLWPIFWDDNDPPQIPDGDGEQEQAALRAAMLNQGYPRHGHYNLCQ